MQRGIYRHYKGNEYQVFGIGLLEENLQEMVIYQALYAPYQVYIRPKEIFQQMVEVDGIMVPRFSFIKDIAESISSLNVYKRFEG